jgi:cell division protease FtsH
LTEALIEREVLSESEITHLIGKRAGAVAQPINSHPQGDEVVASLDTPT